MRTVALGFLASAGAALAVAAAPAQADVVSFLDQLPSTGAGLAGGTVDPNYKLTVRADGVKSDAAVVVLDDSWVFGYWMRNSDASKWISPSPYSNGETATGGDYVYTITFNLAGVNAAGDNVVLKGQWATDDGATLEINGQQVPGYQTGVAEYGHFTPFAITSGFQNGVNTLAFKVNNLDPVSGNPTALRAEFLQAQVVPLPMAAWAGMSLLGVLGGAKAVRSRRKA